MIINWFKNLFKKKKKHIRPEFKYEDFGNIRNMKRECPLCGQVCYRTTKISVDKYKPVNGIIVDEDCECHHWR